VTGQECAFYVVANSRYFLGLAGLINSLRLVGHDEPIYVADCGLAHDQRARIAEQATLVEVTRQGAPHHAKQVAPLAYPSQTMVLIDADMLATRSLAPLIERARGGMIATFADQIAHRFHEQWAPMLGLEPLRRQPYVNTGLVVVEGGLGTAMLAKVQAGYEHVDIDRTLVAQGSAEYPFYYVDQDVFNAYLATYPEERIEILDHRYAPFPPFPGLRVVDEASLRCSYADGEEPFVLHHVLQKPWLARTSWNIYSRLLTRVLLGRDVAIPLEPAELPLRLRTGRVAGLERRRSDAVAAVGSLRGRVGLRRRLVEWRREQGA
jgi:hypothetical protein